MNYIMRKQRSSVNLLFALLQRFKVLITTCFIVTKEGIFVKKVRLGRNRFIINVLPLLSRHHLFCHIELATKFTEDFTILTFCQPQRIRQVTSHSTGLVRRSVYRRHPLCQKRNRVISLSGENILGKLLFNYTHDSVTHSVSHIHQIPKIIPTTVDVHKRNKGFYKSRISNGESFHANTKQSTLSHASTNISSKEKPTHRQDRIIFKCSNKFASNVHFPHASKRRNREVQVKEILSCSLMTKGSVLGVNHSTDILSLFHFVHKFHVILSFLNTVFGSYTILLNLL